MASAPRDNNRQVGIIAASDVDQTAVVIEADPSAKAIKVAIAVDDVGIGGGTEYTEGDTDSTITGKAILWEDSGNALSTVSSSKPLPVDLGANNDVTLATLPDTASSDLATINSNTDFGAVVGGGTEATALRVTLANNSTGVVSVDDNGGAITVDGTVTANLGATDNQVLDNIEAGIDELKTGVVLQSGTNGIGKLTANSGTDGGAISVTLSAFADATNNVAYGSFASDPGTGTMTNGSGFTELTDFNDGSIWTGTEWKIGQDTGVDATFDSVAGARSGGIAIELAVATATTTRRYSLTTLGVG